MLLFTTVMLAISLAAVTAVGLRKRAEHLERIVALLRFSGDDGVMPSTVGLGLDRLESRLTTTLVADDVSFDEVEAALDEMPTGAVVADATGEIILRNRAALPFAGGRHGDALVEAAIRGRLRDALEGDTTDEELRLHGPPERILFIVGSPLIVDSELIGAIVLVDDVTEHHRLDAIRRDFVANVSHELRTPVGALSLLAETLEGESDPDIVKRFLGRIQDETDRLARLIDDLLDLSRIEAGVGDRVESIELGGVIREAVGGIREAAAYKGIVVDVDAAAAPIEVRGDHGQLVSAVTNLLENAVKYTDAGGDVSCRLVSHGNEAAIAVIDTGVGISQKDHHRVFERFYRVDRGRSSATGGTGLGLSIVRHVAVNHGGRVEVASHEGVGSTFTMILPIATASDRPDVAQNEGEVAHE